MTDEQKIRLLKNTLRQAGEQFRKYERLHLAKEPPDTDKADVNADMAENCEEAVKAVEET